MPLSSYIIIDTPQISNFLCVSNTIERYKRRSGITLVENTGGTYKKKKENARTNEIDRYLFAPL